jgi:DNA-binding response OmpR family regulator
VKQKEGRITTDLRALVVDDDETSCQLLTKVLRRGGINVEWMTDGLAAYAKARQFPYDLYVLDVRMPLVLGTDLAAWLKADHPQARVILISAFADAELQKTATSLGATLLSKPFPLNHLLQASTQSLAPCLAH